MRQSRLVPMSAGKLLLPPAIRGTMHLHKETWLHGTFVQDSTRDESDKPRQDWSLVLSPIPTQYWESSYRLDFMTSPRRGSLAAATKVLVDEGLNILSLRATAATLTGDLHVAAVVEVSRRQDASERKIKNDIATKLKASNALSPSLLYRPLGGLKRLHFVPLAGPLNNPAQPIGFE